MRSNIQPISPEELMAYLDGELPADRAAVVAAHLEECRECHILAAEFKSISESLTAWEVESIDLQGSADVAKALDEREQSMLSTPSGGRRNWFGGFGFRRFTPWAGGALAGGLAVLFLGFLLISTYSRNEQKAGAPAPVAETGPPLHAPTAIPAPGANRDRLASRAMSQWSSADAALLAQREQASQLASNLAINPEPTRSAEPPTAPMILRTAQLTVVTQDLDRARSAMDRILRRYSGYVGDLTFSAPSDGPRKLTATLRVPANQLDAAMAELKTLGRVESESQSGQDVTAQYVDLEARLSNSRNTEQRLIELLRQRTGKLSDVLEVETELSRVREEIERMEGERRLLSKQVEYATLTATVTEEYKAPARAIPDSLGTRFRNASVDGYQSVVNFLIGVALFLVSDGPMLLLWLAILFFPARFAWRKFRHPQDRSSQE